ncbi:hypothetical protein HanXRQr2_Chr17g0801111 [Helianthus annuus]|uniref:Uncharacterized protein n=1 Tax=Helianthus annuus TaxID=4232 RepID=A0A251RQ16_HELAN|nr:hypothetical protein HanXRQr2_Chr17g0801111 [Helianthus annuus]KAJ0813021.1 hypothetical protein HanPSC8_Chr17g0768721 [Helianthus annuus]
MMNIITKRPRLQIAEDEQMAVRLARAKRRRLRIPELLHVFLFDFCACILIYFGLEFLDGRKTKNRFTNIILGTCPMLLLIS